MFSALQQCTWTTSHITGGVWYLDCAPSFTTSLEIEFRKSKEDVSESGIEMLDLRGKGNEMTHQRRPKKTMRVKEVEEKADQKERAKLQKSLEKSTKKGKRKMDLPPHS